MSNDEKKQKSRKKSEEVVRKNKNESHSVEKNTVSKRKTVKKNNIEEENNIVEKEEIKKKSKKIDEVEEQSDFDSDIKEFEEIDSNEDEKLESNHSKLKKSDLFLIICLIVVVLLGCFLMRGEKEKVSYELPLQLSGEAGLQLLSYSDYQKKIDNNEAFVIVLSRESCSHCANFLTVAEKFASDNQLPMYYVDTDTFNEEDWSSFEKSNTFLKKNSGNWGTPTTIVLAGHEAVDYIEGETTRDKLMDLYNQYFDMDGEE